MSISYLDKARTLISRGDIYLLLLKAAIKVLSTVQGKLVNAVQEREIAYGIEQVRKLGRIRGELDVELLAELEQSHEAALRIIQAYEVKPVKETICFETIAQPKVSIIIPVFNKIIYTHNCLKSLKDHISDRIKFEIIIVDDCSTDATQKTLSQIDGLRVIRNEKNLGFIQSCNRGASEARGDYLCFLNNDTRILPEWLESMVSLVEADLTIGAVGSKLIYPDAKLQEAGNILWQNAAGWNYGRLDSPYEPEYNFVKEVDACSGASLLVRASLFQQIGGFRKEFIPAYYEDTDLCFSIRKLGYKVVYQPKSEVIHYEGITSGTDIEDKSNIKNYQKINQKKFLSFWKDELLANYYFPDEANVVAASRRLLPKKTILVVDAYITFHDRESGSLRLFNLLCIFKKLGYAIIFLPDNSTAHEPYRTELQQLGIEVLFATAKQPDILQQLDNRLSCIDIAWLCRPDICSRYSKILRKEKKIKIVYDTVDLHFVRLKRQSELQSEFVNSYELQSSLHETEIKAEKPSWQDIRNLEVTMARGADATVVVTDVEKQALDYFDISKVWVIPNMHQSYAGEIGEATLRKGLLFIGSYAHPPNVDAVMWLCEQIMPKVWEIDPSINLTLLGSNPTEKVQALAGDRVLVPGYIKDVEPYFLDSRVFVAPLRFGAGMKGKIGQSLSYGLPTVTTSIGAEGMGLVHGVSALIADAESDFVQAILTLYQDLELWQSVSNQSLKHIQQFSRESVQTTVGHLLDSLE